jgi:hypothetical protein
MSSTIRREISPDRQAIVVEFGLGSMARMDKREGQVRLHRPLGYARLPKPRNSRLI